MNTQIAQNNSLAQNQNVIHFPTSSNATFTSQAETETAAHIPSDFGFRKYSAACLQEFTEFKDALIADLAAKYSDLLDTQGVRYAVNEADSIAAFTAFPELFLPVLAEEKVQAASQWNARQRDIRARSLAMAA